MMPKFPMTYEVLSWPEWRAFADRLGIVEHPEGQSMTIRFVAGEPVLVEDGYYPLVNTGRLLDLEDNHA